MSEESDLNYSNIWHVSIYLKKIILIWWLLKTNLKDRGKKDTSSQGSPGDSMVKNLPVREMQETWIQSLDREDSLEEMATHSSILAWRISWTEEPGRLQSAGSQSQTWLKWLSMHTWEHQEKLWQSFWGLEGADQHIEAGCGGQRKRARTSDDTTELLHMCWAADPQPPQEFTRCFYCFVGVVQPLSPTLLL